MSKSINRIQFLSLNLICLAVFCLTMCLNVSAQAPYFEESSFVVVNEPAANCGDFLMIANGSGNNRLWVYFNREGQPVRIAFHGRYTGTLTNSVTGASLLDSPSVANISVDLIEGTQTNVGAFFNVTVPGAGAVLFEAGRLVFDGEGMPVFIAGPHRPVDEIIDVLCDALR